MQVILKVVCRYALIVTLKKKIFVNSLITYFIDFLNCFRQSFIFRQVTGLKKNRKVKVRQETYFTNVS